MSRNDFSAQKTGLHTRGRYVRVYVTMTTEFSEPEDSAAAAEINFNLVLSNTVTYDSVVSETWYVPSPRHPDVRVVVRSPGIVSFLPHHRTNAIFQNFNNHAAYVFV